jgi:hypothetical protein
VILEERSQLGNPQKEISFSIQFNLFGPSKEVEEKAEKLFDEGIQKMNEQTEFWGQISV